MNIQNLIYSECDLRAYCLKIAKVYLNDIDGEDLINEISDAKIMLLGRQHLTTPLKLLQFIVSYGNVEVFPNLRTILQICLSVAVSIATCERSFSKLNLIENFLRTSMGQNRLSDLSVLSIERGILESIDFTEIVNKFATVKARKEIF